MRHSLILLIIGILLISASPVFAEDPAGTTHSRPNVSGGYDFFDAEGNKIGSSAIRTDGGYDYYDQYGNLTGSLAVDPETDRKTYQDIQNVQRGELVTDPYGGYRYKRKGEDIETSTQTQIRKDHKYADPYGGGLETLPPDIIQGNETKGSQADNTGLELEGISTEGVVTENSGLGTSASGSSGLETSSQ
ncbi:MAG: hypothetical protein HQ572_05000 [Candidatus Omnitrophica bacterium]|nr:hypothetical protein [Candidatus Omnitrophota bacterium]